MPHSMFEVSCFVSFSTALFVCTHTSFKSLRVLNVELVLLSIMVMVSEEMTHSAQTRHVPGRHTQAHTLIHMGEEDGFTNSDWHFVPGGGQHYKHDYLQTHKHPAWMCVSLCVLSHFLTSKPPALFALKAYFNIPSGKPAFGNGLDEKCSNLPPTELMHQSVFILFLFFGLIIYILALIFVCIFLFP